MVMRNTSQFAFKVSVHKGTNYYQFIVIKRSSPAASGRIRERVKKEFPNVPDDNIKVNYIGKVVRV